MGSQRFAQSRSVATHLGYDVAAQTTTIDISFAFSIESGGSVEHAPVCGCYIADM
jgi:hypothetical protein